MKKKGKREEVIMFSEHKRNIKKEKYRTKDRGEKERPVMTRWLVAFNVNHSKRREREREREKERKKNMKKEPEFSK